MGKEGRATVAAMEHATTRRRFVGAAMTTLVGGVALGQRLFDPSATLSATTGDQPSVPGANGAPTHAGEKAAGQPAAAAQTTGKEEAARALRAATASKALAFLRLRQDGATGGWETAGRGPVFPAITGLALWGLLRTKAFTGLTEEDPAVSGAVKYILGMQRPDGGIYDTLLPSYNTAICLSALCEVQSSPLVEGVKAKALAYLRTIQNGEEAVVREGDSGKVVDVSHPFYGGVGYGKHGRPDLSNTAFFVEALHAAGIDATDPAMKRAMVFLQRVQMQEKVGKAGGEEVVVNDQPFAKGSRQGGFIYSTSENKDKVGSGQSFAGMVDETLSDGTVESRLRSYGSMTYAGFKSYLYAGLSKNDPRVGAARAWIVRNYTLAENPGVGTDGLYYYYVTFAKALAAWGEDELVVGGATPVRALWKHDLGKQLASLQEADGSFKIVDDRWMENNPTLTAAYAMCALGCTV